MIADAAQAAVSKGVTNTASPITTKYARTVRPGEAHADIAWLVAMWPRFSRSHRQLMFDIVQALCPGVRDTPFIRGVRKSSELTDTNLRQIVAEDDLDA